MDQIADVRPGIVAYSALTKGARVRKRSGTSAAVERAFWLSVLAEAIEEAQALATKLGPDHDEGKALLARLKAIRDEVEALRRGHDELSPEEIAPLWTNVPQTPSDDGA